jgi:hypothetical protein
MSKETQSYWFSDMGIWGSNPVSTYEFGPEHHDDMHEVFDFVHDHELGDFMAYLQTRPHKRTGALNEVCVTCEELSEQFGIM